MHVVVTGASAGIGAAPARAFGAAGASLPLVARRRPLLQTLAVMKRFTPPLAARE